MLKLAVNKWGNSSGLRLPTDLLKSLGVKQGEFLKAEIKNGKLILEKDVENELTWEELFKDYEEEPFDSEIVMFKPVGKEKW